MNMALSLQDKNIKSLFDNVEETVKYIRYEEQLSFFIWYGSLFLNFINILVLLSVQDMKENSMYVIYTHITLIVTIISMRYNSNNNNILSHYIGYLNRSIRPCLLQFRIKNRNLELKSKMNGEVHLKGLSSSRKSSKLELDKGTST